MKGRTMGKEMFVEPLGDDSVIGGNIIDVFVVYPSKGEETPLGVYTSLEKATVAVSKLTAKISHPIEPKKALVVKGAKPKSIHYDSEEGQVVLLEYTVPMKLNRWVFEHRGEVVAQALAKLTAEEKWALNLSQTY